MPIGCGGGGGSGGGGHSPPSDYAGGLLKKGELSHLMTQRMFVLRDTSQLW